ncbi:hypothetical protein AAFG13_16260 [Bradyrhizobium sp. B124]|uniref:hypothetical protein n=1 Tax=Bradyrhizobium sp. B124 TaxID=3140245 RepID=UPI00318417EF
MILQGMVDYGAGLVVLDPDRRFRARPVVGPFDVAGNHVLRALQPLEADNRRSTTLRLAALHAAVRELVGLFSRDGMLHQFDPGRHRDTQPRVRDV